MVLVPKRPRRGTADWRSQINRSASLGSRSAGMRVYHGRAARGDLGLILWH